MRLSSGPKNSGVLICDKSTLISLLILIGVLIYISIPEGDVGSVTAKTSPLNSIEISDSTGHAKTLAESFRVNTVLIAYFCTAKDHERRSIIRSVMADRYHPDDTKVVFVTGTPDYQLGNFRLELETDAYGDIFQLSQVESQDSDGNESGKSLLFFKTLRAIQMQGLVPEYKFILKVEMDSFVHVENLIERLFVMKSERVYMGRLVSEGNDCQQYMAGIGYILSLDLVSQIAELQHSGSIPGGSEDQQIGSYIRQIDGESETERVNYLDDSEAFADHPLGKGSYSQKFHASAIVVHECKENVMFLHAVRHFYPEEFQGSEANQ